MGGENLHLAEQAWATVHLQPGEQASRCQAAPSSRPFGANKNHLHPPVTVPMLVDLMQAALRARQPRTAGTPYLSTLTTTCLQTCL